MSDSEDDEDIKLSADTLAALGAFYAESAAKAQDLNELQQAGSDSRSIEHLSIDLFPEDWNTSQFWYDEDTAVTLAQQLLDGAEENTNVAIVSAPSVFVQVKRILSETPLPHPKIFFLEYDPRFEIFAEFVQYDFEHPERLHDGLKNQMNRVLCDPPFHSADCVEKMADTIKWLMAPTTVSSVASTSSKLIFCTGEAMEDTVMRALPGCFTTTFEPSHKRSRLSNKYACFANFECSSWEKRS